MKLLTVSFLGVIVGSLTGCASMSTPERSQTFGSQVQYGSPKLSDENTLRSNLMYEILAGEIAGKRGEISAATKHYLNASKLSNNPKISARTARIATFSKDFDTALSAAKRWVALEPESSEARQVVGLLLVRNGESEAAAEHLGEVIELGGEDKYELSFARMSLLMIRESVSDAELKTLQLLREKYSTVSHAHRSYAELAYRAEKYEESLLALQTALEIDPDDESSRILKNRVLLAVGRVDEALEDMREMTEASVEDAELLHSLARMLVQAKRYEEAHAQYKKALKLKPGDFDLLYSLSLLEVELKKYDEAVENLKKLAKSRTHADDANYYLGRVEEERSAFDLALSWYLQITSGERYLDAQTRVASMLGKLGKQQEALDHLAKLRNTVSDKPTIIRLYLAEGDLLRQVEENQQAYDLYTGTLDQYPNDIDLLYARAMVGESLGRIDWLERDLTVIIKLEPDNATALNALGYTLADHSRNLPQAHEYIKRALLIRSDDPAILDSMGWVNFRLGNLDEAEKYLTRALSMLDDPEIASHLGEVQWTRGQHDKAIETVRKALQTSPKDDRLLKLQNRLKE